MTRPFFQRYKLPLVGGSLVVVLVGVLSYVTSIADIRPFSVRGPITEQMRTKGLQVLGTMQAAHGGAEKWRNTQLGRFTLTDQWSTAMQVASPWPQNPGELVLSVHLARDNTRLKIKGGPVWGVQNWVTYQVNSDGTLSWDSERDFNRFFWPPTLAYFIEAPFRLVEGEIVAYAGEDSFEGRICDLVFVTWGDAKPSRGVDQYVAWVDRETGHLAKLEYTVRDYAGFYTGATVYRNLREVHGFTLPFTMEGSHVLTMKNVELGAPFPVSDVLPEPTRRANK